jgi:hypothetical protein
MRVDSTAGLRCMRCSWRWHLLWMVSACDNKVLRDPKRHVRRVDEHASADECRCLCDYAGSGYESHRRSQ